MSEIRGLTVKQPWATCIVGVQLASGEHVPGAKPVENRSWRRKIPPGGLWLALHAGKKIADFGPVIWSEIRMLQPSFPRRGELPVGKILGLVRVDRILPFTAVTPDVRLKSPWCCGPYCWLIDAVVPLDEPIPYSGMQGLWPIRDNVVHAELQRVRDDYVARSTSAT